MKIAASETILDIASEAKDQDLPYADQDPVDGMGTIIGSMLSSVMTVAVIVVLFFLVTGSVEWITAGGDSGKVEKARTKMMNAVIGLIVLAATIAFINLIQEFLDIQVLNFGGGGGGPTPGITHAPSHGPVPF